MNWNEILSIDENDPNICMNNLHLDINYLLDEFTPYKNVSKQQSKLKPWINGDKNERERERQIIAQIL